MSYDTTYASRYVLHTEIVELRLNIYTINTHCYLRGISDEKRLDEIFWIEAY